MRSSMCRGVKPPVFLSTASPSFAQNYYVCAKTIQENVLFYEPHFKSPCTVNGFEMVEVFFSKHLFDWENYLINT